MRYAALLRGINVGGNKMVSMAELRRVVGELGFGDPRTLLQSGNLIFDAPARSTAGLESLLEKATLDELGVETKYFIRKTAEWHALMDANPFVAEASADPTRLIVSFCRAAPDAKAVAGLRAAIVGRERVAVVGREAFIVYPDGQGTSKLTPMVIERALGTSGTARNWNTVTKIRSTLDA